MERRPWIKLGIIIVLVLVSVLAAAGQGSSAARLASPSSDPWPVATPPLDFLTVALQQGVDDYAGAQDTFVDQWEPDATHANDWHIAVRTGGAQVSLLRFDVSEIPPAADVALATLKVYAVRRSNDSSLRLQAWKVNRAWDGNAATWTNATAVEEWAQPGCNGVPADRDPVASEVSNPAEPGSWSTLDVTEMVRQWVADPEANWGLLLGANGGAGVRYDLASSDYPQAELHPVLTIVYALRPTPVPTYTPSPTPTLPPILEVVKEDAKDPICITEKLRYYISVYNRGDATASNVLVTDHLPLGTYFVDASPGGTYSDELGTVTWAIDELPSSARKGLYLEVGIYDWIAREGLITNVVAVTADNATTATDHEWTAALLPTPRPLSYCYIPFVGQEVVHTPRRGAGRD